LNQSTFLGFDPIAITANERLIAPQSVGISSELKNNAFRHAAGGTWMFRHFRWLQAIENGSHSKTTFSNGDVEKAMDGFFNNVLALEDQVTLVNQVVEPLIENNVAVPPGIEFRTVHSHQTPECCMSTFAAKPH